ncbi:MAG TPA: hypothetical protein V6D22_15000 [Candidatus Obscuribacterales bacterium]
MFDNTATTLQGPAQGPFLKPRIKPSKLMVPPPPPNVPVLDAGSSFPPPLMQALAGALGGSGGGAITLPQAVGSPPAIGVPTKPVLPTPPTAQQIDPVTAAGLEDEATNAGRIANQLEDQARGFTGLTMPAQAQQSDFERQMETGLQNRMRDLLIGRESAGERFDKGFDLGQKLAANIMVPLAGVMSKSAGAKMGYAQVAPMLRQQAQEADRARAAELAQRNNLLMQMSQLWENMSPQSSKNLMELAKQRLAVEQSNRSAQNDALRNALSARANAGLAEERLFNAKNSIGKENWDRSLAEYNAKLHNADTQSNIDNRAFMQGVENQRLSNDQQRLQNEGTRIGLEQRAQDRGDQQFAFNKGQAATATNFRKQELQANALKELLGATYTAQKDAAAPGAIFGTLRYPGLVDKMTGNPAYMSAMQSMIDRAGLPGVNAQDLLRSAAVKQKMMQSAKSGGFDLGGALNAVANPINAMANGVQREVFPTTAQPQQAPPRQAASNAGKLDEAIVSLQKKLGRAPTPDEVRQALKGGQ